jgi:hypothetical protein
MVWSDSLWQTFFASCVGANVPALAELPLSVCVCRKFHIDTIFDHLYTFTSHSDVKKAHDWSVAVISDLLTRLENIVMTIVITPLTVSSLWLVLLVRLGGYIVNLCVFDFYKFIGKLTTFLNLQEFSLRNITVPVPLLGTQVKDWQHSR